ncbi:MAG: multicopper oxidase domain-containing protein, partial [Mycobacteriaceae bacterium]
DNPYYDPACDLDVPATWQYQTDPYCEPKQIPGTPNVTTGMEQFNDTPIVNGQAYPTTTVQPKPYRLRMLNAANDRFFNFQWYTADATQGDGTTEVALKPAELAAAQTDPTVSPTPLNANKTLDANGKLVGPDWVQIGSEGGFLPAPAVIDGQQPTTWITDPTRFDFGNVDKHSLLLAPAERADVIVDFSKFAGQTLILYNDAPAAFPARVPSYDYYTGAPDMSPAGAPKIMPGYGPNTRTVMQVKVADAAPAPAFNLAALQAAFRHNSAGTGVFESGQHPTIVGQAAYNSAYGTNFAAGGNCNTAGSTITRCDGLVRVNDTSTFGFNTLKAPNAKMSMPLQPKAMHDEMNATTFDEYGRMQATLGVEAQPPTPGGQNVTLYPYVNPQTELIDGTNLPTGDPNTKVTPIADAADGTQIWRITHNGVDTHPIHFHLFDVQVLNRVTWDNIIIPPDANELGWKDTVRVSPLEDTIVALRPVVPKVPFEVPNSVRPLNPMMPNGDTSMFNNVDPQGNPTANITNQLVNFGWEYVYHCHILSHEEMDMMRPVTLALPPVKASGLTFTTTGTGNNRRVVISWNDNSITETSFVVQRSSNGGTTWTDVGTVASPLDQPNIHGSRTFTDPTGNPNAAYLYRVAALNTVGYGAEFPSMTVKSISDPASYSLPPTAITASASPNPVKATQSTTLRATLTSNGTPQSGKSVQLCYRLSSTWLCPTFTTNASGVATLAVNAPNRAGTFPVVAKFLGSATLGASQSAQYDVNIQAVVASATPNPVARNTNTTLKATLTSGATPTARQTVQICYTPSTTWLCPAATTNASGQVSRVVKVPNAAGTMPVVAKWMTSPVIQSPQLNVNIA